MMSRPIWFVNLLKRMFPGRYLMAGMTNFPPVGKLVDFALFREDNVVYLPRDGTIQINADIEKPVDTVLPSQIVDHFIEQASYHWVMNFCICREGENCQEYPHDYGCIFLGSAVLKINSKLGRLVSKEQALAHAQRCREAGLVHIIGRNRLDMVWLGATPGENLMTICNCCPCCCLWKMLPKLSPEIGDKISKMPGVHVFVTDECAGCGECTREICFVDAIQLVDGFAVIDESCRGCGKCVEVCPNQAIEISIDEPGIFQNTIDRLSALVDIN
jgi:ferredoxin